MIALYLIFRVKITDLHLAMSNLLTKNLLIGSSNVYKYFDSKDHGQVRDYKMIRCTQMESFEAHMTNMAAGNKFVVISVIENFMVDVITNITEPDAEFVHCVRSYLKLIMDAATRLPETKFAVVLPLQRPAVKWYQEKIVELTSSLEAGIKTIQLKIGFEKIACIKCTPISTQDFATDNIHLTEASAKIFLDHILSKSEDFFTNLKPGVNEESDQDVQVVLSLEERLTRLETAHMKQVKLNFAMNLMLARVREEIDMAGNRNKEDRVVLNGLKSKTLMPVETRPRIEWLKGIAMDIFKDLVPNFPGEIFYLNQGQQMVEVKLDSVEKAMAVRRAFAEKRKNKSLKPEFESLFVTNCVNLATRVRIDVLRAIARKITNDKDIAYVSGFISRPMMHIKSANDAARGKPLKSFTFIDAVSRFHNLLKKDNLVTAYERAGWAFRGQLEQNFIVLNDAEQIQVLGHDPPGTWNKGRGGASSRVQRGGSGFGAGARGGPSGSGSGAGARGGAHGGDRGFGSGKGIKRPGVQLESENAKK